ncbi:putative gustatory receptor 28a [Temnothorax longispinosus]|uniref:putative gustatory receptor 28a n=1 Tax=Temnothorax longispinosus TaxID=300112 RepID=UPI003A99CE11
MYNLSTKFHGKILHKWRVVQVTDFQSLMYPCFIFCYILGIFPYKINALTFKISKPRCMLSTVVICVTSVYSFILLHDIIISEKVTFGNLSWISSGTCYYIFTSFITIVTYILSGPRMRLLQAIMDVSSKLPSKTYRKLSRLIYTKDIISFFLFIVITVLCFDKLNISLTLKLFTIYISLVEFQMNMLYFNCVCILKACFKRINDDLANLREPVVNNAPHLFNRIYHKQRNLFLLMELKALKKQHLMISDTVQMLNLVFSLQLLAFIAINFCDITFSLYFYASKWSGFTNELQEDLWYSYFLALIIYQSLKMSSIIWACETGKNQALEIGTTVHVVFNSISDEDVKNELQLFSLQILQRKNIFSAKGLNVDATLLAAIVGNITTYLLILMQFLLMSNSCNGKSTNNIT